MISVQATSANQCVVPTALFTTNQSRWVTALALPLVVGPLWCLVWRTQIGWLGTLAGFVLLSAILTSAYTDFRWHRIFNWVTYTAFLWALLINTMASILSAGDASSTSVFLPSETIGPAWLGGVGLKQSLAGAAVCFVFTLVAYHLSGGGAGDVKIAAVIGAFLGVHLGLFAVGFSYIIAAIVMGLWTVYSNGPLAMSKAMFRAFGSWIGVRLARFGFVWPFPPNNADTKILFKPVPLGPFFAIGTILTILDRVLS